MHHSTSSKGEPLKIMNYGKAFRIIRAAFGLSQSQFSSLLKIGQSQVSLIESGKRQPSKGTIDSLANSLQIPQDLIHLLASEPSELQGHDFSSTEELARSLLHLLVSASEDTILQPLLPFIDDEDRDD
jgi:transcriptional regulator with XRE-family HTH domain